MMETMKSVVVERRGMYFSIQLLSSTNESDGRYEVYDSDTEETFKFVPEYDLTDQVQEPLYRLDLIDGDRSQRGAELYDQITDLVYEYADEAARYAAELKFNELTQQ